jgi:hypothetical protein
VVGLDQTPDETVFPDHESGLFGKAADFALTGGNTRVVNPISSHLSLFLSSLRARRLALPAAAASKADSCAARPGRGRWAGLLAMI